MRSKEQDLPIPQLLQKNPDGMKFEEIASVFRGKKPYRLGTYFQKASRPTVSKSLHYYIEKVLVKHDILTHKYSLTANGEKYVQKAEIADSVLRSNYIDAYFNWMPSSSQPEFAVYNLLEAKETASGHSMAMLVKRMQRTKPLSWDEDFIDYAVEMNLVDDVSSQTLRKMREGKASRKEISLLQKKIREIWKIVFDGVERMTVVETVSPEILLKRLEQTLEKAKTVK